MRWYPTWHLVGIAVLGLLVAPGVISAKERDVNARVEKLRQNLSLTDEQTEQVRGILEANPSREGMQQVQNVLTDEQKAKYDQLKAQRRSQMGGGGRSGMRSRRQRGF